MGQWKQSVNLAKMELKVSSVNLLLCWILLSLFGIMLLFDMTMQYKQGSLGFHNDILFLFLFGFAPLLFRAKHFQYNKISKDVWASPTLIMQSQLPIPKDVLTRSRFIIYLAYYIPTACLIFFGSYMMSHHLRAILSISEYIVFAILWLAIGFSLGIILAASDVGDVITTKIMVAYSLGMIAVVALVCLFFYKVIGEDIISFTIILAKNYSVIALMACLILVIFSWLFWPYYMKKTIQKLDYL